MIRMENVKKSFDDNHVLQGMNLEIPKGTSMVIIGGSGTGKSVALKCILGLIKPDSGMIYVDGKDASKGDRDAFLARFGMLFQGAALFDSLPVWQNVAFRLLRGSLKRPTDEAREIAIEKLRRVGLKSNVADRFPSELSGGMQKRVGLARALITDPDIILYDEPNAGLDPEISRSINELMREIADTYDSTALVVEHRVDCIRTVCDEAVFLVGGEAIVHQPTEEFLRPTHPRLVEFLGPDALNAPS